MPESFLHGIEIIEVDSGSRPIATARSSVIGIVGTAPDADEEIFPLNMPTLVVSPNEATPLGNTGTLSAALTSIFAQAGALVVVIRVEEGESEAETLSALLGSIELEDDSYQGMQALLAAQSSVHVTPRLLIVPGFTHQAAVVTNLLSIDEQLRAVVIADGPNTNDTDVITYCQNFGSARLYLVDPWLKTWDANDSREVI